MKYEQASRVQTDAVRVARTPEPPRPSAHQLRDATCIAESVVRKCWPHEYRSNPTPWDQGIARIAPQMVAARLHLDAHEWGKRLAVLAPTPEGRSPDWTVWRGLGEVPPTPGAGTSPTRFD